MLRQEELQEIENMGEGTERYEAAREQERGSAVPLVQAALCALFLLALVCVKYFAPESYDKAAGWYRQEMTKEIELPGFAAGEKTAAEAPAGSLPEA